MLLPGAASAQAGRVAANEGNRLYGEGRYDEAHERYLEALRESPGSAVIRFNDGNALYQGAEFDRALEAYQDAAASGDPALLSDAWYNMGNVMYRQQELPLALEAFKQALRLDPADIDAKHNLERVLEQMQNPPQDESEDDQSQDDQNEDQKDQNGEGEDDGDGPDDQDQPQDPDDQEQDDQEQGEPPPGAQGQPPQMSREEAERLLEAIQEDQDEVNRQPRAAARGRRPRKDW
jgi:tetratricopeptide (TPR) repeat protein